MKKGLIVTLKKVALERFPMWAGGVHGPAHWERVRENAVYLVKHSGGDVAIVEAFAYLHDCCRVGS